MCEEVSASTTVDAWSLPDNLIAELYCSEPSFRQWCNTTVFVSDAVSVLEHLIHRTERNSYELLDILGSSISQMKVLALEEDSINKVEEKFDIFIGSANSSEAINTSIVKGDACYP